MANGFKDIIRKHSGLANTARKSSWRHEHRGAPLPIPNREVKPCSADGTALTGGRAGGRQSSIPINNPTLHSRRGVWAFIILLKNSRENLLLPPPLPLSCSGGGFICSISKQKTKTNRIPNYHLMFVFLISIFFLPAYRQ